MGGIDARDRINLVVGRIPGRPEGRSGDAPVSAEDLAATASSESAVTELTPRDERYAAERLRSIAPHASAARRLTLAQMFWLAIGLGALIIAAGLAPSQTRDVAVLAASGLFSCFAMLRVMAIIELIRAAKMAARTRSQSPFSPQAPSGVALRGNPPAISAEPTGAGDVIPNDEAEALPLYSIICPLYREASVAQQLVDGLASLDYPAARLDILFMLEADDVHTVRAVRSAVAVSPIRACARIVTVPPGIPRTKPKVLNVGLQLARGMFTVVYDAEDVPHPAQLRAALAVFGTADPSVACLQAQLTIDNPGQSWLTTQFAMEYRTVFVGWLPAL